MPEPIARLAAEGPLPAERRRLAPGVELEVPPPRACVRLAVLGPDRDALLARRVAGLALPAAPGRWAGEDPFAAWISPEAWLLQSTTLEGAALAAAARDATDGLRAAVTDLSDALAVLRLRGPGAAALLARGCGLDLSPAGFAAGAATRTRLAQLAVQLRRLPDDGLEILVDRPLAAWLLDWLVDAAAPLAAAPAPEAGR